MRSLMTTLSRGIPLRFFLFAFLVAMIDLTHDPALHHVMFRTSVNYAMGMPSFDIAMVFIIASMNTRLNYKDLSLCVMAALMGAFMLLTTTPPAGALSMRGEMGIGIAVGGIMIILIRYIEMIKAHLQEATPNG